MLLRIEAGREAGRHNRENTEGLVWRPENVSALVISLHIGGRDG